MSETNETKKSKKNWYDDARATKTLINTNVEQKLVRL